MARPRQQFTPTVEAEIRRRRARGESAIDVAHAIGQPDKARTIGRHYPAGGQAPPPLSVRTSTQVASGDVPEPVTSEVGEGAPDLLEAVDPASVEHWIKTTEAMMKVAAARGETGAYATLTARLVALMEHKRKTAPVEREDPNSHPDMVEAAKKVRKRWHDVANALARVSNSPLADTIHRLLLKQTDES